jgi:hypothetical protein
MNLFVFRKIFSVWIFSAIVSYSGNMLHAKEVDGCHIKMQSGVVVQLNKLCGSKKPAKPVNVGSQMKPGEVKINPDGSWIAMPGGSKPVNLPDGSTFYPDGRIQFPGMEGFSLKLMMKNEKMVGAQFYGPDGLPMKPGEFHKLSSGEIIEQRGFE